MSNVEPSGHGAPRASGNDPRAWMQTGSEGNRTAVYMHLLRAAADPTDNYRELQRAVVRFRDLLPTEDPRRQVAVPGDFQAGPFDERNRVAMACASGVLDGVVSMEDAEGVLSGHRLGHVDRMLQPNVQGPHNERWRTQKLLAETAIRGEPSGEFVVGGWPVYATPYSHETRERLARILVDSGSLAPDPSLRYLAALVTLQRIFGQDGWAQDSWASVRALMSDDLPAHLLGPLVAALSAAPPDEQEMLRLVSEAEVPMTGAEDAAGRGATVWIPSEQQDWLWTFLEARADKGGSWPSYFQIREGAGLSSDRDVTTALNALEAHKVFKADSRRKGQAWELLRRRPPTRDGSAMVEGR